MPCFCAVCLLYDWRRVISQLTREPFQLMWQGRKIVALMLLVLFAPASMADALPLVWCLAPSGHNAIELYSGGCHKLPAVSEVPRCAAKSAASFRRWTGEPGGCRDFVVSQSAQTPTKLLPKTPPSPDPVALDALSEAVENPSKPAPSRPGVPLDPAANQLAQLRTVVLLI